jgi:hypothetical protein
MTKLGKSYQTEFTQKFSFFVLKSKSNEAQITWGISGYLGKNCGGFVHQVTWVFDPEVGFKSDFEVPDFFDCYREVK